MRQLCKGNVAIVKAAIVAGCRAFYGYPITPASEIAEYAALLIPEVGGTFLQAESEVSAINMVYGASSAGMRVMTASSGPGLSLMQEGISYMAGAELPGVIVDVVRGGPGLGNIAPEQSDYFCIVKGGGHGCYRNLVLAPSSVQEMFDLTVLAFDLADRYRNPVVIMTDGYVGQMMEPLDIKLRSIEQPAKDWAVKGTAETRHNMISSIVLEPDALEAHIRHLESKYLLAQELESRHENYLTEDADVLLVGFGIVARVLRSAIDQLRAQGVKAGLFRPITLWPFPSRELCETAKNVKSVLAVELSTGMMVEDVRLALNGTRWRQRSYGGRDYGAGFCAHGGPRINRGTPLFAGLAKEWIQGGICGRLSGNSRKIAGVLRQLRSQSRDATPDALLPRLRTRHRPQADRRGAD
jgi:pyruvate/2-oxoacid:ferredoxin oxidoreductase alpha subunit